MEPTLRPYNPTWRDQVASWMMGQGVASPERRAFVGGLLGSTGLGNNGVGVVDATPAGGLLSMQEASQQGDRTGMALAAAGLLPVAGVAEKVAAKTAERVAPAAEKFITAYHGSPHSFDKFDLSKIGTGEGAQAYGHGLYFADNEGVAKSYRDALSTPQYRVEGKTYPQGLEATEAIWNMADLPEKARYEAGWHINRNYPLSDALQHLEKSSPEDFAALKTAMEAGKIAEVPNKGSMYQVRINADPEHFLDWNAPLSEQTPAVQKVLGNDANETAGGKLKRAYNNEMFAGDIVGADRATADELSRHLAAQGIPGIKYLDQGSRGAGEGSRNYVVFDDSMVEILKKYGLVGLLGGGAAMGASQQQPQQPPSM